MDDLLVSGRVSFKNKGMILQVLPRAKLTPTVFFP